MLPWICLAEMLVLSPSTIRIAVIAGDSGVTTLGVPHQSTPIETIAFFGGSDGWMRELRYAQNC